MDCPICKTTGLSEDTKTCPHCHSDLQAIQLIERAETEHSNQKRQKALWMLLAVSMALAFLIAMLLPTITGAKLSRSEFNSINEQLSITQEDLKESNLAKEKLQKELQQLKAQADELKTREMTYTVQWGENLYTIAAAVYGDGEQYKKIAADNALKNPNHILDGQKLLLRYE